MCLVAYINNMFDLEGLMKKHKLPFLMVCIFILAGFNSCSTTGMVTRPRQQASAQIVIERQDVRTGTLIVFLNARKIGRMNGSGRHYFFVNREGYYTLHICTPHGGLLSLGLPPPIPSKVINLRIANDGQRYVFRTEFPVAIGRDAPLFELVRNEPIGVTTVTRRTGLERAIERAGADIIDNLPTDAVVAVINIASNDAGISNHIINEMEFKLFSARRFALVDRLTLDRIRMEQNFHLSGEVSDASAVSIGQMLGANIVVTGSITGTGANQTLNLRAIDVETARIVNMARETF